MKPAHKLFTTLMVLSSTALLSACPIRLIDFTVISSKNFPIPSEYKAKKRVRGGECFFLGLGFNLKGAVDKAIENAGSDYVGLVDGVLYYTSYPFVICVDVEGTPITGAGPRISQSTESPVLYHSLVDNGTSSSLFAEANQPAN